jgi:hypothetical protein
VKEWVDLFVQVSALNRVSLELPQISRISLKFLLKQWAIRSLWSFSSSRNKGRFIVKLIIKRLIFDNCLQKHLIYKCFNLIMKQTLIKNVFVCFWTPNIEKIFAQDYHLMPQNVAHSHTFVDIPRLFDWWLWCSERVWLKNRELRWKVSRPQATSINETVTTRHKSPSKIARRKWERRKTVAWYHYNLCDI